MKTIKFVSGFVLAGLLAMTNATTATSVKAAYYPGDDYVAPTGDFFDDIDDDRVLPMPDGGFLHGEIIEVDAEDHSKVLGIYNSSLDPNAVTVEEAKKMIEEGKKNVSFTPYANYPSTSVRYLGANDKYLSDEFSGTGWRFGHYYFLPTVGTGDYLKWQSINDGGRVGNFSMAYGTLNGTLSGQEIQANSWVWCNIPNGQQYYTYNPLSGTRYLVNNPV